jgi:hyperosmotically inducible protein
MMSKRFTHWTLLGLGLAAGAACSLSAIAQPDDGSNAISDSAITAQVKATLAGDSHLQGSDIHVKTDTRVVTLRGKVVSDEQRRDAVRTTEDVRGVDSVDDELAIAGGRVTAHPAVAKAERVGSDSWITTKVKLELVGEPDTRGFDIHVKTLHGVVMLQGSLPTEHDVEHVCDVAGQIQGVRRVDSSELRISGGG